MKIHMDNPACNKTLYNYTIVEYRHVVFIVYTLDLDGKHATLMCNYKQTITNNV